MTHAKLGLAGQLNKKIMIPEPMGLGGRALQYGKSITVGRFRCSSSKAGLTCVVIRTRKGLLISTSGITRVVP